jgi:hypothetical protein
MANLCMTKKMPNTCEHDTHAETCSRLSSAGVKLQTLGAIPAPRRGLSREESASYLGISPSKFDQLRKDGRVSAPKLIDCRKVWDIRRLDEAFDALPEEGQDAQEGDWTPAV